VVVVGGDHDQAPRARTTAGVLADLIGAAVDTRQCALARAVGVALPMAASPREGPANQRHPQQARLILERSASKRSGGQAVPSNYSKSQQDWPIKHVPAHAGSNGAVTHAYGVPGKHGRATDRSERFCW
jgi:hypothetical protein